MNYPEIVKFHGHECPGLAMGYRMTTAALKALEAQRAEDEELVAIVENDACGVDALQCLTGCTFGKGNLLFRDYGKHVYTVYSRATRKGVRVVFHGRGMPENIRDDREAATQWLLSASDERILTVTPVSVPEPEPARIMNAVPCAICSENVMASRVRNVEGKTICIPCSKKHKEP
jgi:formylmethanofuran dehydrogenase subunit E